MKNKTRRLEIVRVSGAKANRQRDLVARESPVTILLNDVELVTLLCSPSDLENLAAGFLFGEGLINSRKEIKSIFADSKNGAVWVETKDGKKPQENLNAKRQVVTGCGKAFSFTNAALAKKTLKADSKFRMSASSVLPLMKDFQGRSEIYRKTGGVHSAGLANLKGIIYFSEDIGRHNAIDKVLGECLLKVVKTDRLVLVTSGRVSSDIVIKAGRSSIPIIVSKSAPTDLAVALARELGIAIVGFVRGSRMNVYSNEWRLLTKPRRTTIQ